MKWFKHESNSIHEAAIEKLIQKYGAEGYGLYYACIELIAQRLSGENIDFELHHDSETLGTKFRIDTLKVEEIIKFCIKYDLFQMDITTKKIFCLRLFQMLDVSTSQNPEIKKIASNDNYKKLLDSNSRLDKIRLDEIRLDNTKEKNEIDTAHSRLVPEKLFSCYQDNGHGNDVASGETIPNVASCQQAVKESHKVKGMPDQIKPRVGQMVQPGSRSAGVPACQQAIETTQYFYDKIMTVLSPPRYKNNPPELGKWAFEIDKLIRIDGVPVDDIKRVINWTVENKFWSSNILSGKKLREKFNVLFLQMKKDLNVRETHDEIIDSMQRRAKEIDEIVNQDDEISRFARGMFSSKGGKNERINGNV